MLALINFEFGFCAFFVLNAISEWFIRYLHSVH